MKWVFLRNSELRPQYFYHVLTQPINLGEEEEQWGKLNKRGGKEERREDEKDTEHDSHLHTDHLTSSL